MALLLKKHYCAKFYASNSKLDTIMLFQKLYSLMMFNKSK